MADEMLIGGVYFNSNQIKASRQELKDGKAHYTIEFKTGATLSFPEQEVERNSSKKYVYSSEVGFFENLVTEGDYVDTRNNIAGLYGATFTGSKNDDCIEVHGCENCTINVANDENDDLVDVSGLAGNKNVTVKTDSDDKILLQQDLPIFNQPEKSIKGKSNYVLNQK